MSSKKLIYPSAERNKDPILEILKNYIHPGPNQKFLEIASGSGQHIAHFAPHFPQVTFYPSEYDEELFSSIIAHCSEFSNIKSPVKIDISKKYSNWSTEIFEENTFDYMYASNLMHISPYQCSIGLLRNAARLLCKNGILFTYGPFSIDGKLHPESNIKFDKSLKSRDPEWGIRDITDLRKIGQECNIILSKIHEMPANNKTLIWIKQN